MSFGANAKDRGSAGYSQGHVRGCAGTLREVAGWGTQHSVVSRRKNERNQELAAPIRSSSVVGLKENSDGNIHRRVENHGCANPDQLQSTMRWETSGTCCNDNSKTLPVEQIQRQLPPQNEIRRAFMLSEPSVPDQPGTQAIPIATHESWNGESEAGRSRQTQFPWELRKRMQLMRAQREEELRRELYVGTGPEGRR